jgi:putative transcriptional regulator
MKSLHGKLLLDHGKLTGSAFHRTVVLICQHDPAGAFGLILNRPTPHTVGEAIAAALPERVQELPLFLGGPVQPQAISYLVRDALLTDPNVLPGLQLSHSLEEFLEPEEDRPSSRQFKFFAGYSGWGPGQLDNEMKADAWLVHPAPLELIFHPQPDQLWKIILRGLGLEYRLLADAPDDVSWN